ncbi:MAG TPA: hypothetical protein VK204_06085 [Nocardioidaceae bacterium]|nr:hypothetical protein [Nocardioidaceae bacterium]
MDTAEIEHWFAAYLADFTALGRGDLDDVGRILAHYGVPLIISSEAGCLFLTDEAQVRATAQQQIDALRAAGYDRSNVLAAATTVLNQSCAVHRGRFVRLRADGSEISSLEATYLITDGPAGRRISVIAIHSAP